MLVVGLNQYFFICMAKHPSLSQICNPTAMFFCMVLYMFIVIAVVYIGMNIN